MSAFKIGRFSVLKQLGSGAHSTILHIRRSADAKHYALKVVPINNKDEHKFLEQARHEFSIAQALEHDNLIKIHALEQQRDWLFRIRKVHLLIEYVNGQTLDLVQGLTMPRLVQVFERVAAGLMHMHRRSIFHADLKPNNILLSKKGEVKIIDYGLAWRKDQDKRRVQGTVEYMAPEQARSGVVNESTDMYNFGATMYRLVTWQLPPSPLTVAGDLRLDDKTWQRFIKPVKELKPGVPTPLCDLIHKCLAYEPAKRPERLGEVKALLQYLAKQMVRSEADRLDNLNLE